MAHIIYDNFVLENKVEEMVKTQIDMNNYLTPDYSLAESAGMVKKVNVYDATGAVEELAMGEGNTEANDIEVGFVQREYRVKTTQGRFPYYDEQEMSDPMVVEVGLQKIAALMVNDLTDKAIAEMSKAKIQKVVSAWNFDTFADAIAACLIVIPAIMRYTGRFAPFIVASIQTKSISSISSSLYSCSNDSISSQQSPSPMLLFTR